MTWNQILRKATRIGSQSHLRSELTHKANLVLNVMAQNLRSSGHLSEGRTIVKITKVTALSTVIALSTFLSGYSSNVAYANERIASASHSQSVHAKPEITEEKIGNRVFQTSKVLVHAKADHVFKILTDYDNAPLIFPCLKKCKVLKEKGNVKTVQHQIKPSGFPGTFEYVLDIKEIANRTQEWRRVSGDFSEVEGFWKLDPTEDGNSTHVTYASYVNGGFFLPQALIKRQTRMDVPAVMTALKSHAETSHQHIATAGAASHKN